MACDLSPNLFIGFTPQVNLSMKNTEAVGDDIDAP